MDERCDIKTFVQKNSLLFKTGRGFYEFTKPEKISDKKEVVLIDKVWFGNVHVTYKDLYHCLLFYNCDSEVIIINKMVLLPFWVSAQEYYNITRPLY